MVCFGSRDDWNRLVFTAPSKVALLDALATRYSRASTPRHMTILLSEGDDLKERLHKWIVERLRKGIPSLFKVCLSRDYKVIRQLQVSDLTK